MGVEGKQLKDRLLKAMRRNLYFDPLNDHIDITRHLGRPGIQLLEVTSSTFVAKGLIEQSQEILIKLAQKSKNLQKK